MGAVVSILALAIDPFLQQLVSYSSCNIAATNGSTAYISRSSIYNEYGPHEAPGSNPPTIAQKSAIVNGFFGPSLVQVDPVCTTGNCTYDNSYASLGFISECVDVTSELTNSWTNISYEELGPITLSNGSSGTGMRTYTEECYNTSLPSNLSTAIISTVDPRSIVFTTGVTFDDPTISTEMILGKMVLSGPDETATTPMPQGWYAGRFGLSSVNSSCSEAWQNKTWGCQGVGAARCTMKPSVNVLNASIAYGVLTETLLESYSDWYHGTPPQPAAAYDQMVMADLDCVDSATRTTLQTLSYNTTRRFMPWNVWVDSTNGTLQHLDPVNDNYLNITLSPEQISLIPKTCIYQIDGLVIRGMRDFLVSYLSTTVGISTSGVVLLGDVQALKLLNNTYIGMESIGEAFTNIANAISVRMREWNYLESGEYNVPAEGAVFVTETCVGVHWLWLIYPASVTLLIILFFLAMLLQTESGGERYAHTRGWKSSPLPLIYHPVEPISPEDHTAGDRALGDERKAVSEIRSMNEAAKKDAGFVAYDGDILLSRPG